jgi:hypothetical protein
VDERLDHVGGGGDEGSGGGDRGAETEGDGHRNEEERESGLREGASGEHGEDADRGDVDTRRRERQPFASAP